jgi:hypothetical protein
MTVRGFTFASAGGATVQTSTATSTPRAHSSIFSLGDRASRPARRAIDFTGRDIGGTAGMIEENSLSRWLLCACPLYFFHIINRTLSYLLLQNRILLRLSFVG